MEMILANQMGLLLMSAGRAWCLLFLLGFD